jgi:AraC family transcriptional activator of pobA
MQSVESISDFYARVSPDPKADISPNNTGSGHFNVFTRSTCNKVTPYARRDFYKISLVLGKGRLHYADKFVELDKPALLFSNPLVPYSWQPLSDQKGWYCLFTDNFVWPKDRQKTLQDTPLYNMEEMPAFFLDKQQQKELSAIFIKMMEEMGSDYVYKFDLLRNYLHLLIHEAMKMKPLGRDIHHHSNASQRLTHSFLELLERQFPIDSSEEGTLVLKTAIQYADQLSVHVNHLNRALKDVTGKTTSDLISSRIVKEANALLRHSDWNISEIAYGLGFEYPAYFNTFYKKQTGLTPNAMRKGVPALV